jgi:hypothetical protein
MARTSSDLYNPGGKRASRYPNYPLDTVLYYWDDIRVPASSVQGGAIGGPTFEKFIDNGAGSQGVYANMFDPDTPQEVFFHVQMPHRYREGTPIYPHVHWSPTTDNPGTVKWWIEYTWTNANGVFPNTEIDTAVGTLVSGSQYLHVITGFDAISYEPVGGGPDIYCNDKRISSMLMCRLLRQADVPPGDDDYPDKVALLEIDFHFQIDAPGSIEEYRKVGSRDSKYRL